MKMKCKKWIAFVLALVMACALIACTPEQAEQSRTPEQTAAPAVSQEPAHTEEQPAEKSVVRLAVLSGPTGVGAAKLLSDAVQGTSANEYQYIIAAENS